MGLRHVLLTVPGQPRLPVRHRSAISRTRSCASPAPRWCPSPPGARPALLRESPGHGTRYAPLRRFLPPRRGVPGRRRRALAGADGPGELVARSLPSLGRARRLPHRVRLRHLRLAAPRAAPPRRRRAVGPDDHLLPLRRAHARARDGSALGRGRPGREGRALRPGPGARARHRGELLRAPACRPSTRPWTASARTRASTTSVTIAATLSPARLAALPLPAVRVAPPPQLLHLRLAGRADPPVPRGRAQPGDLPLVRGRRERDHDDRQASAGSDLRRAVRRRAPWCPLDPAPRSPGETREAMAALWADREAHLRRAEARRAERLPRWTWEARVREILALAGLGGAGA